MAELLNLRSEVLSHSPFCVNVFGTGPKGGEHDWTVHYAESGKDEVAYTYHHHPASGWHPSHQAPLEVLREAAKMFSKRNDGVKYSTTKGASSGNDTD